MISGIAVYISNHELDQDKCQQAERSADLEQNPDIHFLQVKRHDQDVGPHLARDHVSGSLD